MVRFPTGRIRATEEPQRWRNRSGASSLFVFDYLINDLVLVAEWNKCDEEEDADTNTHCTNQQPPQRGGAVPDPV